jgi:hypothetical protein
VRGILRALREESFERGEYVQEDAFSNQRGQSYVEMKVLYAQYVIILMQVL